VDNIKARRPYRDAIAKDFRGLSSKLGEGSRCSEGGEAMPIYQFYCPDCNTIYNFFCRTVNTEKVPPCPRCKKASLERKVSLFAVSRKGGGKKGDAEGEGGDAGGDDMDNLPFDEAKMAGAMESLAKEAENISEDDPRQAAGLMRKLSDMTGMQYGEKMQEAINRMEAGEDPEAIEAELGDALEKEDPFVLPEGGKAGKAGAAAKRKAPTRDETLYEM
jgi:putative FmdB family regulatory protein